jgi:type IV pilus assembly protein PilA
MHAAIVIGELRRRNGAGLHSRRQALCCGVDLVPESLVLVALLTLVALFLGWLTFRTLSPLPILGERLWGRFRRAHRSTSGIDGTAPQAPSMQDPDKASDPALQAPMPAGARPDGGAGDAPLVASKWMARADTLFKMFGVVVVLTLLGAVFLPSHCDYTPRAKVAELILAGSAYRTAITERFASELDPANAGADLTFRTVGKVSGGSVSRDGTIVINGSTASTSVGMPVTITITPTYSTATGNVSWKCMGQPTKLMPATCK